MSLSRLRKSLRRRRRRAGRRLLAAYYRVQLRLPRDRHAAVFAAYWYRGYSCNPRAIYEELRRSVPGLRCVWVVRAASVSAMPAGVPYVVSGTRAYFRALARSTYFVNNVNFPNHLVKRAGAVHLMTHHGTPLKKMGTDLAGPDRRIDLAALARRCGRWDYSLSANPHSTAVWERVYPGTFESLEYGFPRNDLLARAQEPDVRRARDELGLRPGQTAVLYAPTHREYRDDPTPPLDLAGFAAALGDDHVVLARLHYFYADAIDLAGLARTHRVVDVGSHPSIETLYLAADVLLTDYSSVMFDYAVLDRPIAIHAPDWAEYAARRGTYFDLRAEPPGFVAESQDELVAGFRSGAVAGPDAAAARAAFRERFCALEDGHAAERVVRRLWAGRLIGEDATDGSTGPTPP